MNDSTNRYISWKDWREESFGSCGPLQAAYFVHETGIAPGPGVRVLEIGFGNGAFIGWAHAQGVEVFGVELNPALVERARSLIGGDRAFLGIEDRALNAFMGSFTHIVAFDVIEHIGQRELPAFLRRLRELLTASGRLILRFPNGDSPFGRINQHGDPTHLTTLGSEKLIYLAHEAGLTVESIRAPRLPRAGVGIRRALRRSLLGIGRGVVERLIGFLYFGGRVIPLDPNYVAVLIRADASA
jgi:2-polyprenyl-3-methyl-5-hydroxy-6-metoxy-1,4-benzoquinol methylase